MRHLFLVKMQTVLVAGVLLLSVSCGKQGSRVKDVNVKTEYIDGNVHLGLDVEWNMGNIQLPQVGLPIFNPKTFEEIGSFQMMPTLGGNSLVHIDLNLTSISSTLSASEAALPNGSLLPLIGLNKTIEIPIQDKVVIYLTMNDSVLALGLAINIKGMDVIGANVGATSLFPVFNVKNVIGAAGLYTSKTAGQNGIGFFADLSQVIADATFIELGETRLASEQKSMLFEPQNVSLDLAPIYPSNKKEKKIEEMLYKMHKKKARLSF